MTVVRVYGVQVPVGNLCSVLCPVCSVHFVVCSVQCSLCSMQHAVCSVQCVVCSMQCTFTHVKLCADVWSENCKQYFQKTMNSLLLTATP